MTATDTEAALLAAIRENPGEDAPRLVWADWLEENARTAACAACKGEGKIGVGNNGNPYMATCDECHGTGRVSDGRAEWAEFIRLQCELAANAVPSDATPAQLREAERRMSRETWGALRARECELWPAVRGAFEGEGWVACLEDSSFGKGEATSPGNVIVLVSRGFPAIVRCTLGQWRGGECENCGGFGEFRRRHDNGDGPEGPCPDCGGKWNSGPHDDPDDYWDKGTGRTPGIGPRLAQRWPVVAVEVTDVSPMNFSFGSMFARGSDESSLPDWLPDEIHAKLPTGKTWHTNNVDAIRNVRIFKDEPAARAALSAALIAWARGQEMEGKR